MNQKPTPESKRIFIIVIIAMMFLATNMRSPIAAIGSLAHVIEAELNITQTQIGWIGSIPVIMFVVSAIMAPKLIRRFSVESMMIGVILLLISGILIRVLIVDWSWFVIGTFALSLAIGLGNTLAAPVVKHLTPNHIPLVTGLAGLTTALFAGLAAGVVVPIADRFGWRWSLGGWAVFSVIALFLWCYLKVITPSNKNIDQTVKRQSNISMWKTPMAWQLAIFIGSQSLMYFTFASFLPSIAVSRGLTPVQAGNVATVFMMMAPAAIIFCTVLIRNQSTVPFLAYFSSLCNVIGVIGVGYFSVKYMWFWAGILGFGGALVFTLGSMLLSLRSHTTEQAADLSGMTQTVGYVIAIFGPIGTGWLHEQTGSWMLGLNIMIGILIMNFVFAYFSSRPKMIDGQSI